MTSTNKIFFTALNKATPRLQRIINSEIIYSFIEAQTHKHSLSATAKQWLVLSIADVLLQLRTIDSLKDDLQKYHLIKEAYSPELAEAIIVFIQKMQTMTTNTTPAELSTIAPLTALRTMEIDAKKIHGYGAFRGAETQNDDQPVYHSEQAKLVPPPAYTDDSSPSRAS